MLHKIIGFGKLIDKETNFKVIDKSFIIFSQLLPNWHGQRTNLLFEAFRWSWLQLISPFHPW